MDIKPCQKCGCGSSNEEGNDFPFLSERYFGPVHKWVVACQNISCMAISDGDTMEQATDRWNSGDVV